MNWDISLTLCAYSITTVVSELFENMIMIGDQQQ